MIRIKTKAKEEMYPLGRDVEVFNETGELITGVLSITIDPINANSLVTATLQVLVAEIDIEAGTYD